MKIEINKEEFVQEAAGEMYLAFCNRLRALEKCDGTINSVFNFAGRNYKYALEYYLWYDVKNRNLTWQFDVSLYGVEDDEDGVIDHIEQWLVDVVNDTICFEVSKDNDFE